MKKAEQLEQRLCIHGEMQDGFDQILSAGALAFVEQLVARFAPRLEQLLKQRQLRQAEYDGGALPDFRPDTAWIRDDKQWKIAGIPQDLQDRRVEITGPVDRKMVINGLNSGARVFMCCFEDATAPTWQNMVQGQINLRDANNGTIDYVNPANGKHYRLNDNPAVLICRPRGLHLSERHITFDGQAIPGCLMDFGLYFYHNYRARLAQGSGIYYYLPKLQSMEEAAWWSELFSFTEDRFELPRGSIKATVLIETLPAVFQMDEILYAMREHIVAMNCGRWDYIFSYIKSLRSHGDRILPDRQALTMDKPFLDAYSRLLIRTTHRRGALAMGGMAAYIPAKDPQQMEQVLIMVQEDKEREALNGHDGTWVAHPGLVSTAMEVFDRHLAGRANQLDLLREQDQPIDAAMLLTPCEGQRSEAGVRKNIRIALRYIEAWISGRGCVPIYGLMEDAATAEISRTAIWQWISNRVALDDGREMTPALFRELLDEEYDAVQREVGELHAGQGRFAQAKQILDQITVAEELVEFLTLPGYRYLQ
ncbi:malate synthase A [Marinobacterium arenosum]|uniref:malate synthase A n=1 Tax=Marinobacterium arenosum TaxID=2862496 RepID=UPI001C951AA5|nr:malate synthase A [Marinobacterium arenosum]MBY4678156.1 malate synthase A [Marinobacterium arenosum]